MNKAIIQINDRKIVTQFTTDTKEQMQEFCEVYGYKLISYKRKLKDEITYIFRHLKSFVAEKYKAMKRML